MIVANTHLFKIRTPNMKAQTIILSIASIAVVTIAIGYIYDYAEATSSCDKQPSGITPQQSELFLTLPDYCPTPDGMAIAPNGDLIVACPNFADQTQPACLIRVTKNGQITKWIDVPTLKESGYAAPMGIAFDTNGDLIVCDNQGWTGNPAAISKGRLLRLKFDGDILKETVVIAENMEHPNGVRIKDDKIYVTQSSLPKIKDKTGLLVSGVYAFDKDSKNINITNTLEDKNLITTVITQNPEVQYGLDGLVFDKAGNLYVGNFGDGSIHKITFDASGNVKSNDVWAQDTTQMRTTDGICIDNNGNIIVADFSANGISAVDTSGKITRLAQSPDCDGSDGGLDQPGEPIIWNDMIVVSCFDIVTGPDKVNTKHDKPYTLAKLGLVSNNN